MSKDRNTFHLEFAESLGLCLFCHCHGDDNPILVGVWDRDKRVFVDENGDMCGYKCDDCGFKFVPSEQARFGEVFFTYDCHKDEPPWVGFNDYKIFIHVQYPMKMSPVLLGGLLEWGI